jgi:DNA-binding CsgD family transcriptional regulator
MNNNSIRTLHPETRPGLMRRLVAAATGAICVMLLLGAAYPQPACPNTQAVTPLGNHGQLHAPQPERGCHRLEQLAAAMAMLRPAERQILQWRYGEDLRCAEIASRLRVSLRTAKRKLAVARQRVKAAMKIVEESWHDLASSND